MFKGYIGGSIIVNLVKYAPIKVFKTLDIKSEKEYPFFSVTENPLPNLIPDIYIL